jgi:hypothetical protein
VTEIVSLLREWGAVLTLLSGSGSAIASLFPLYPEAAAGAAGRDLLIPRRLKYDLATAIAAERYAAAVRPFRLADVDPRVADWPMGYF